MNLTREQISQIKSEKFKRTFALNRSGIDEEKRTVEIAFSSEEPYMRWFGLEILGHEKGECDLEFLNSGRAPLLDQHDHNKQRGVIEKAWVDKDRKGRAIVRFGKSDAAEELFQDVIDGIKCNVSVGYSITDMKLIESSEEKGDTYRITWTPFENSLVSVPADKTVGVGRSQEEELTTKAKGQTKMPNKNTEQDIDPVAERAKLQKQFENDTRDIMAIGEDHGFEKKALEFISNGKSPEEFRSFVLAELKKRGLKPVETPNADLGLSKKEVESFSFIRAINALANPTNTNAQKAAGFEFEASRAVAEKLNRSPQGLFIPMDVLKRELTVGTATAGGNLVSTDLLSGSFIDLLQNRMMVARMGATILSGLVGDVAIPRQTGGATVYWVDESGDSTESDQSFDQVKLQPKTVAARTQISRKLLLQSSIDVEMFTRNDLARALAIGIDYAGIAGDGSGAMPTGITFTNGVGAVIGGTNGLAPTWAHIVGLWSEVAADNADIGALGFLTNSKIVGTLMQTEKATGTAQFVCKDFPNSDGLTSFGGSRAGVTNQVPSNLTKGTGIDLSAIIYGNWSDLLIGLWGTLDIVVDSTSSNDGSVTIKTYQDADVGVRHPESFSVMNDAITI